MTHCIYCGAERDADQCLACSLTSAAAEVRLWRRLVRRTVWVLAGSILFVPVGRAFPPLDFDGIVIFVGTMFFLAFGLGLWMVQRARRRQEVEVLKRIYFALLPIPWILSALLFANGKLDTSPVRRETVSVVGKFSMPGILRTQRLVVTSWREGRRVERVFVGRDDFNRFQVGDEIVIGLERGLVGIPWVYAVYRP